MSNIAQSIHTRRLLGTQQGVNHGYVIPSMRTQGGSSILLLFVPHLIYKHFDEGLVLSFSRRLPTMNPPLAYYVSSALDRYPKSFILFAFCSLALVARKLRKHVTYPLPPSPPSEPIIGNLRIMPTEFQWKTFAEWGRKLGMTFLRLGLY